MDWFGITSLGGFPTPGITGPERASLAVSYGLLNSLPEESFSMFRGLMALGLNLTMN